MKYLLIFSLLLLSHGFSFCQRIINFETEDSVLKAQGLISVDFKYLPLAERYCFNSPIIIDSDSLLQVFKQTCRANVGSFDIDKFVLLTQYFRGDCHLQFKNYVYLDANNKKLIWKVYNIWGGCRAASGRRILLQIPKPPEGYEIIIDEIFVDKVDGNYIMGK